MKILNFPGRSFPTTEFKIWFLTELNKNFSLNWMKMSYSEVIKLIIHHYNSASAIKYDDNKRIPLHHAVEFEFRFIRGDSTSSGQWSSSKSTDGSGSSTWMDDDKYLWDAPQNADTPIQRVHV